MNIVIINGWMMPKLILSSFIQPLLQTYQSVKVFDLPIIPESLTQQQAFLFVTQQLDHFIGLQYPVTLIGWSFGGNLATMYASQHTNKVNHLITLSTNATFIQQSDWFEAMPTETFQHFFDNMQKNPLTTFKKFVSLCAIGNRHENWIKQLKTEALQTSDIKKHYSSLFFFATFDCRFSYKALQCLTMHCFGEQDSLVPISTIKKIAIHYPHHIIKTFLGGHGFFLGNQTNTSKQVIKTIDTAIRNVN